MLLPITKLSLSVKKMDLCTSVSMTRDNVKVWHAQKIFFFVHVTNKIKKRA